MPAGEIVQAGGHGPVKPLHRPAPFGIRFRLVDAVRIVDYHHVGPLAGSRAAHRSRDAIAGAIVLETILLILITAELVAISEVLLIPVGLDQAPALDAVSHAQIGSIAGEQPSDMGPVDPHPGRPKGPSQ